MASVPRCPLRRAARSELMYWSVWAQTLDDVLTVSLPFLSCTGVALAATSSPATSGHASATARAVSPGAARRAACLASRAAGAAEDAGEGEAATSQTSPSRSAKRSKSSGAGKSVDSRGELYHCGILQFRPREVPEIRRRDEHLPAPADYRQQGPAALLVKLAHDIV